VLLTLVRQRMTHSLAARMTAAIFLVILVLVTVSVSLTVVLARSWESVSFGAVLGLLLLNAVLAAGAGAAVFRVVRRTLAPLSELSATAARVVAEGDFRTPLEARSQDEIGRLTGSFAALMAQTRSLLLALRNSSEQLESASAQLAESASVQNEAVSQQAVALHETQMAAQQLQEASRAAAKRVEAIQREAERASVHGQEGEAAVSGSVGGLTHIRSHVEQMGRTISELHQRTRQVGDITRTVKDLADQSNVLALNASIEAARSGETGRSFAVVAREMRSLADQSAGATTRVQAILGDIGRAISDAVRTSEGGAREVEGGLEQVRAAGESLRSLATIIQNNGQTVKSIADAVSQQDAGIAELFIALSSMADSADQVVDRMAASEQAAIQLSNVSSELGSIVGRYQL
jgi:methyl-accepting chemotaxis protein